MVEKEKLFEKEDFTEQDGYRLSELEENYYASRWL